ncbi:unnamed protein product [Didymodactylos carnosus]|uniref:Uncharacterized protein n=1 Tax=Didymodactylos carnosus TaxID=1234261 RepID=A0A8S2ERJ2_9BILA|nr:unnamed protein product [Didymodactylos carnosus]CAF4088197.1 unnamed protein product [Didymodactylos carnosus]
MSAMHPSVIVLLPRYEPTITKSRKLFITTDEILISADLNKKLEQAHPLPNPRTIMPYCHQTFPRVTSLMNYTLQEAVLLYRQLFYSTIEEKPSSLSIGSMLEHIESWTLDSAPTIIDFGGSFETQHLHYVQLAYPGTKIYSIDTLYRKLDLLVCNLNNSEIAWCIIPVFSDTNENIRFELIKGLNEELTGTSSVWNGIEISEFKFRVEIKNIQVYDPYSEIFNFKQINFVDSLKKCENKPCCIFMAYNTYSATPSIEYVKQLGLIDPVHTKIDMKYARGNEILALDVVKPQERPLPSHKLEKLGHTLLELHNTIQHPQISYHLPSSGNISWLNNDDIATLLSGGSVIRSDNKRNSHDSLEHLFGKNSGRGLYFNSDIDCLNLRSLILKNNIEILTPPLIKEFIEQHLGGFWKNDSDRHVSDIREYPQHFVRDCLHELLGCVSHVYIDIDSTNALHYSSEFIKQLKQQDQNLHVNVSVRDTAEKELRETAIILCIECNKQWVLLFADLDIFFDNVSSCLSIDEIQLKVESSFAFTYSIHQGKQIKWHKNLSFVYVASPQELFIKQVEDRLTALNLQELCVISKKLECLTFETSQSCSNNAIIRFDFGLHVNYSDIPCANLLDKWIFAEKVSGPVITIYPNVANFTLARYPLLHPRASVGSVYSLTSNKVLILIQWRNDV